MNITELFTQVDVTSDLKPRSFALDRSQIPGSDNRLVDRDSFRKELEETRNRNSQAPGVSTENKFKNRPEYKPAPGSRSEARNIRSTEERNRAADQGKRPDLQTEKAQYNSSPENEPVDSGEILQEQVDSVSEENEQANDVLSENLSDQELQKVNAESEEVIVPPEGLTEVFNVIEENTSDSNLVQVTTVFEEENLAPPASLFESEKSGAEEINVEKPVENISTQDVSEEPEVLLKPESGSQQNSDGQGLIDAETEEVLLNGQAEEKAQGEKPEILKGETVSKEKLESLNEKGVFQNGQAQSVLGLNKDGEQANESSGETAQIPEITSPTLENPRESRRNPKAGENIPVGQVSEKALQNASDQSVFVAANSEGNEESFKVNVSEHLADVATKVETKTENEVKGLERAVEVTDSIKPGISQTVKPENAGTTKSTGQNGEAKLVDQVSSAVEKSVISGKQMRVRLSPPELGTLMVEVTSKDGVLTARLEVQSQSAQQAIMDNLSQLKEALVQSGNNIETIQVHVNQSFTEESGQEGDTGQNENWENQENFNENSENQQNEADSETSPDEQSGQHLQLDELDIQI